MSREVVLQEKYSPFLSLEFTIPLLNPFFVEICRHPGLGVGAVEKSKLKAQLLVEGAWTCRFANDKGRELLRPIGIGRECVRETNLLCCNS